MLSIVYHDRYVDHQQQWGHPECPERLLSIKERLEEEGFFRNLLDPRMATKKEIGLVHTDDYISLIENYGEGYLDPDTFHREETFEIASLAVGGGLAGADNMMKKKQPFLALVRPPGHHAGPDYHGGFCYFDNIAVTAQYLIEKHGLKKVAIVDPDVHHGNGTSDIFRYRNDVLYISTHHFGIFPGTGRHTDIGNKKGQGFNVNIPMAAYHGNKTYEGVLTRVIEPILEQFEPEAILVSYGLDAHQVDMLGGLELTSDYLVRIVRSLDGMAQKMCDGRIGLFLEGGYNLKAISETVAATVAYFDNQMLKTPLEYTTPQEEEADSEFVDAMVDYHGKYWKL